MASFRASRKAQSSDGPATILAIGTANPRNLVDQLAYPDFYFRVTNADDRQELKDKFKRICDKSTVKRRFIHLNEEILKANPTVCTPGAPSLEARQDILIEELPKLGKEAAERAIKEWGRPKSMITHVIFAPPRVRHARSRLPANQAPRPLLRQASHAVPRGLLRRRVGPPHRKGPRREQPRRSRAGGVPRPPPSPSKLRTTTTYITSSAKLSSAMVRQRWSSELTRSKMSRGQSSR
ncbi:unnamed protein product [Musa acuminata subsp. burmannicoides]